MAQERDSAHIAAAVPVALQAVDENEIRVGESIIEKVQGFVATST